MSTTRNRKQKNNLDLAEYVNMNTGQPLLDKLNGETSLQVHTNTQQFIINNDEYVVFNADAIIYLSRELSNADVGKIFSISNMLKTDCSIVCQSNNHPHTADTLSLTLNMNLNKFYEFVRKMVKKNILAYAVCAPSGHVQKIYMLNPYIARKRKSINCELSTIFRDITKDGELKDC